MMDDNVHMQNTTQFAYELQKAGKQFDLMLYPTQRHGVANPPQANLGTAVNGGIAPCKLKIYNIYVSHCCPAVDTAGQAVVAPMRFAAK